MDWTFPASRFIVAVAASVKPGMSIVQQFLTIWAYQSVTFLFPAIQTYHLLYHSFFFLYALTR